MKQRGGGEGEGGKGKGKEGVGQGMDQGDLALRGERRRLTVRLFRFRYLKHAQDFFVLGSWFYNCIRYIRHLKPDKTLFITTLIMSQ